MLAALLVVGVYVQSRVASRMVQEAKLLLQMQAREVAAEVAITPSQPDLAGFLQRQIDVSDRALALGIQLFDSDGTPGAARGSLAKNVVSLPEGLLTGDDERVFREVWLGDSYPYFAYATRTAGGFVQVAAYGRRFLHAARHIRDSILLSIPLALLVTGGLAWLLARGSLRPIAEITEGARRISGSNLGERLPTLGTGDELDQLAATLNEMMERIQRSVERMRDFSADAAHQLRTPLTALRSQLEVTLEKERPPEEYRRVLEDLLAEVETLAEGVNAMLRLAHSEAGLDPARRVPVALAPLLAEVVEFFLPFAEDKGVRLQHAALPEVTVPGDPAWIHQLFANLVHNGIKYTPPGGTVSIEGMRVGAEVLVQVRDNGVGVAAAERERIFERFHRVGARQSLPGVGLGLPIAREIARAHGGSISVESRPGYGSVFSVRLPVE